MFKAIFKIWNLWKSDINFKIKNDTLGVYKPCFPDSVLYLYFYAVENSPLVSKGFDLVSDQGYKRLTNYALQRITMKRSRFSKGPSFLVIER